MLGVASTEIKTRKKEIKRDNYAVFSMVRLH